MAYSTQRDNYLIDVRNDGTVLWMFPDILRSYCRVDIKYFPFDRFLTSFLSFKLSFFINHLFDFLRQNCTLELQSWSRSKKEVVVNYDTERPFLNHSFIHTEWKLLNITYEALEQNDFVWLEFVLHLKRNHAFYGSKTFSLFLQFFTIKKLTFFNILIIFKVNHMIFPFAILSSLSKKRDF